MAIFVDVLTGGSNNHETTSEAANGVVTDFVVEGVVGTIANTAGVAPATGSFAVNAQGSPNMTVAVTSGVAYVTGTPSSQNSQTLRVKNTASANVTIAANSSGSTKYDWIYISLSAANMANPNSAGDNVATLTVSRSTSSAADDGTPPTYGYPIARVIVANGASSITNGNITDLRTRTGFDAETLTKFDETTFDFVASGIVWTGDSLGSTLNGSMTTGIIYIDGTRVSVSAVTAHAFTASKDTYVDIGADGVVDYTEVSNNVASPALSASHMRVAIVVTGAGSIAAAGSINQGEETKVLPIASSIPYAVTDSLGNLICPRDPEHKLLGYRQTISTFTPGTNAISDVTGLSVPVIVPTNRKVKVTFRGDVAQSGTLRQVYGYIRESSTTLQTAAQTSAFATGACQCIPEWQATPSAGLHTYKASIECTGGANVSMNASSTEIGYIKVELV